MCKGEEREREKASLDGWRYFSLISEREREQQEFRSDPGKTGTGSQRDQDSSHVVTPKAWTGFKPVYLEQVIFIGFFEQLNALV